MQMRSVEGEESYMLKRDILMPSFFPTLHLRSRIQVSSLVKLLVLTSFNGVDLVVFSAFVAA